MKVTTITFRRTLNLGNFNSAQLEKTALADEFEDQEVATQNLIESVLRQLHEEQIQNQIDKEIRDQRKQLAALITDYALLKDKYKSLQKKFEVADGDTNAEEADPDDIPFDELTQAQLDEMNKNF